MAFAFFYSKKYGGDYLIITNGTILSFDEQNTIYENQAIYIKNGTIEEINNKEKLLALYPDEEIIDAKGKYIMPGMVCSHFHTYSSFARGMSLENYNPNGFKEILEGLWWKLDKSLISEDVYYSALVSAVECIKNGTTTIIDHHASPFSIKDSLSLLSKGFSSLGVRGSYCYEISNRDGYEIENAGIEENIRFIRETKNNENSLIKANFGLHAAFTLSDETIKRIVEEESKLNTGFHMHLSEGLYDEEYSQKKYGKSVTKRLSDLGLIKDNSFLVHGVFLSDEDLDIIKESNSYLIHNPQSNMNNGLELPRVEKILEKEINLGMGTDGFSTDMFREIDVCYVAHKYANHNSSTMSPDTVKKLVFNNNSKIMKKIWGIEGAVIKKGAFGDVIIVDYNPPTPLDQNNLAGHLVFGISGTNVDTTIVNGKILMKDKKLIGIDEESIFKEARKLSKKLWERLNG